MFLPKVSRTCAPTAAALGCTGSTPGTRWCCASGRGRCRSPLKVIVFILLSIGCVTEMASSYLCMLCHPVPEDAEDPHGGDRAGDGALAPGGVAEVVASAGLEDLREQILDSLLFEHINA